MEIEKKDHQQEPPDSKVIFAPVDEIRNIQQIIEDLETVHHELLKVAEEMKSVE